MNSSSIKAKKNNNKAETAPRAVLFSLTENHRQVSILLIYNNFYFYHCLKLLYTKVRTLFLAGNNQLSYNSQQVGMSKSQN